MSTARPTTLAIVLDRVPYRERDIVLTLLTRDVGIVSALAPSARGSLRRFGAAIDLLVVSSVCIRPRRGGLASLLSAEPVRQFPGAYESLDRLEAAQACIQLARDLLRDAPASASTFDHVAGALKRVEEAGPGETAGVLVRLCLDLLGDLGHAPSAEACSRCGTPLDAAVLIADGVLACPACAGHAPGARLDARALAILRKGGESGETDAAAALALVTALVSTALGRPWRSAMRA